MYNAYTRNTYLNNHSTVVSIDRVKVTLNVAYTEKDPKSIVFLPRVGEMKRGRIVNRMIFANFDKGASRPIASFGKLPRWEVHEKLIKLKEPAPLQANGESLEFKKFSLAEFREWIYDSNHCLYRISKSNQYLKFEVNDLLQEDDTSIATHLHMMLGKVDAGFRNVQREQCLENMNLSEMEIAFDVPNELGYCIGRAFCEVRGITDFNTTLYYDKGLRKQRWKVKFYNKSAKDQQRNDWLSNDVWRLEFTLGSAYLKENKNLFLADTSLTESIDRVMNLNKRAFRKFLRLLGEDVIRNWIELLDPGCRPPKKAMLDTLYAKLCEKNLGRLMELEARRSHPA